MVTLQREDAAVYYDNTSDGGLYNSSVSGYNQSITIFPSSIVAKSMHCMLREFFEAKEDKRFDVQMKF